MIDREKVIKGLECCADLQRDTMHRVCDVCPYNDSYNRDFYKDPRQGACVSIHPLLRDALELLKEQKPRLLTYCDMYDKDFGYLQLKDDGGMYPVFLFGGGWDDENCMTFMKRSKKLVRLDGDWLNKNWRVWDKCPTPEEAEATPWQS